MDNHQMKVEQQHNTWKKIFQGVNYYPNLLWIEQYYSQRDKIAFQINVRNIKQWNSSVSCIQILIIQSQEISEPFFRQLFFTELNTIYGGDYAYRKKVAIVDTFIYPVFRGDNVSYLTNLEEYSALKKLLRAWMNCQNLLLYIQIHMDDIINMNKYLLQYVYFLDYCMYDFLGGPKLIQIRWVVNFFKALTLPFILLLMYYVQNFEFGTYLYLTLHGSYGIIWLLKDLIFPDQNFQKFITIPSAIGGCLILIAYWILPVIQVFGFGQNQIKPYLACLIIILYVFGIVLMMTSDCQKYYTLKYRKGLINDGLFKFNRNPNYTGEILIYFSFALITNNILSYFIVFTSWIFMFIPFMLRKEFSLSRKEGWIQYKRQSYLVFWRLSESEFISIGFYSAMIVCLIVIIL